jgi:sugar O-acyltransferase (sialic acid O-acetyltransferase NeuD family)
MGVIIDQEIILVGYGGNSFLMIEIFKSTGAKVKYYLDISFKKNNPYQLDYLGNEDAILHDSYKVCKFISTIGNNQLRKKTQEGLTNRGFEFINCIHHSAVVSRSSILGKGIFVSANSTINPLTKIGNGVICNTSAVVEHETIIHDFVHIGPGAVICGNVSIGSCSFIGAGAVVKQGVNIGRNVVVGAGAVVLNDVPDGNTVVGVPAKKYIL